MATAIKLGTKRKVLTKWNAATYHENSSIQFEAASQVLSKISLEGNESILDIGSGDGKITALISKKIPNGKIHGIDLSPEMVDFAKLKFSSPEYPNVIFSVEDGAKIDYCNEFDLVFSSFALQWIVHSDQFMQKINRSLKINGMLVATMPLGMSAELEAVSHEVINQPRWSDYFTDYTSPQRFSNADSEYAEMLLKGDFRIIYFELVSHKKIFSSRDEFEDYVFQWYPYTNYVDPELKLTFFKEIIDRYLELKPPSESGQVGFEFPRIDLIAKKR